MKEHATEFAKVVSVKKDVFDIEGLPSASLNQVIYSKEKDTLAVIVSMTESKKNCVVLSGSPPHVNQEYVSSGNKLALGEIQNVWGKVNYATELFVQDTKAGGKLNLVDSEPLGLSARSDIDSPLITGVGIVDLIVPIAKGQRELVIGDRKTGKTSFLMDIVSSQAKLGKKCIYCCVGKRLVEVNLLWANFEKRGVSKDVCLVASLGTDPSGAVLYTPHLAMTIAEKVMALGEDVLLVMDDLSTHAKYYREVSLSLKRLPGRSSYPADIFYMHAKLLERAGAFKVGNEKKTITCLPVAQSILGDITDYITTNLMSMTDGHIYFDAELRDQGKIPSVNPFLSVTRVGHQTFAPCIQDMSRKITSFLATYERSKNFSHFGGEASTSLSQILAKGDLVSESLNQPIGNYVNFNFLVSLICLIWSGDLSTYSREDIKKVIQKDRAEEVKIIETTVQAYIQECKNFEELVSKVHLSDIKKIITNAA